MDGVFSVVDGIIIAGFRGGTRMPSVIMIRNYRKFLKAVKRDILS